MTLLQKDYGVVSQPPSLIYATGFKYCPLDTANVVHNGAHHWLLLSSIKGQVSVHDSLNLTPNSLILKQIKQLFSPDEAMPPYMHYQCHKQLGNTDCGVFAIAYAIDVVSGNEPHKIRYDQNRMREHLKHCLESGKLTPFPKYRTEDTTKSTVLPKETTTSSCSWQAPKRYCLRSQRNIHTSAEEKMVPLNNRFAPLSKDSNTTKESTKTQCNDDRKNHQISQVVHNISNIKLSTHEMGILEKGLNFCPTTKDVNVEELMDDGFSYCRGLRLKHFFASSGSRARYQALL